MRVEVAKQLRGAAQPLHLVIVMPVTVARPSVELTVYLSAVL